MPGRSPYNSLGKPHATLVVEQAPVNAATPGVYSWVDERGRPCAVWPCLFTNEGGGTMFIRINDNDVSTSTSQLNVSPTESTLDISYDRIPITRVAVFAGTAANIHVVGFAI